ncbi:MAG: Pyridoxal 5-phosphate synthase subunit PdxT [Chloroflexi bacterium]|jgi:5'-phosphate synthase pdxT subunit|nr:Pyridoxal 5-phosphate synthase subunit PdxT [Chloroflexota bacterium]
MHTNNSERQPRIGVLALQGAFIEHVRALQDLGVEAIQVRLPEDLAGLDGLIIPGGESTTIGKLMTNWDLIEPVKDMAAEGKAIWGTCAGMILLAKDIGGLNQPLLGLMDIKVKRNAFGSQLDSFEADLSVPAFEKELSGQGDSDDKPFHAVFIRAPLIEALGPQAEEIARIPGEEKTQSNFSQDEQRQTIVVAARQNNLLATAFHPELTPDRRFHQLFLKMAGRQR